MSPTNHSKIYLKAHLGIGLLDLVLYFFLAAIAAVIFVTTFVKIEIVEGVFDIVQRVACTLVNGPCLVKLIPFAGNRLLVIFL